MRSELILYGTVGCHLCDDAERLLISLELAYQYADIIDDDSLFEQFATSIPVLCDAAKREPLYWPFTTLEITDWLLQR
ncbi:glutaredoxin family protein [Methylophilus aquaticus]|uniref:Glutaredoxin family protein n=1 Tax=Methylophilus aquaticus TaxID=1971610 RepID=A0ABT9JPV4_9PROT|nr:glutaredoxin family protein [Methylophilus aquaticus]MDP8566592.1 glutaredoxin family protein [Methylophilus aquaticus]